ncbi:ABC transporter ATP-binding protein [Thermosulfurimonas dismutans]|uniref:Putative ABC transporter, ATP-binding subunit n=1 Tax=Thermosulfurimonas dismutans TaxID=999894 RepID=A0A179D5Z7_9BACT|nr:ABC transporter ATP-binding protein [Thermosulfurimonas dismutans]OAQ21211.1 putative ABC transporter, ATP-binding subunit [Thermosulfurimonas dismutans]
METVLEVRNLVKDFGGHRALSGVNFVLSRREFLGIIGPNGAGKTTLLNCLLGLITPTKGEIRFFGLELEKHQVYILSRINFASNYVGLPLSLTVFENLVVYGLLYGVSEIKARAERLLKLFGLWEMRNQKTRHLSSGQMMRLCLAKALMNDPEVLLLDEPTAGLDPEIAERVRKLIKAYQREKGLAVIFTSHNLHEMEELSDRVILLNKGQILAEGPPQELCRRFGAKNLEEAFFKALDLWEAENVEG